MSVVRVQRTRDNVPCHRCEERHPGCHAECEKYKAYKERHNEQKEQIDREKRAETNYTAYMIKSGVKQKKKMGKKP